MQSLSRLLHECVLPQRDSRQKRTSDSLWGRFFCLFPAGNIVLTASSNPTPVFSAPHDWASHMQSFSVIQLGYIYFSAPHDLASHLLFSATRLGYDVNWSRCDSNVIIILLFEYITSILVFILFLINTTECFIIQGCNREKQE